MGLFLNLLLISSLFSAPLVRTRVFYPWPDIGVPRRTRSGFERLVLRLVGVRLHRRYAAISPASPSLPVTKPLALGPDIACFAVLASHKTARSRAYDGVLRQTPSVALMMWVSMYTVSGLPRPISPNYWTLLGWGNRKMGYNTMLVKALAFRAQPFSRELQGVQYHPAQGNGRRMFL